MNWDFPRRSNPNDDAGVAAEVKVGGLEKRIEVVRQAVEGGGGGVGGGRGGGGAVSGGGDAADAAAAVVVAIGEESLRSHSLERVAEIGNPMREKMPWKRDLQQKTKAL